MHNVSKNTDKKMEIQLITECSQTSTTPEQNNNIYKILEHQLDWEFINNVAMRNNVLPLVCWNLLNNFSASVPPEVKNQLAQYFEAHTQNNIFQTFKLVEIIKLLESSQIPVLPFKGTTLALEAYENLALRKYCDLDVMVKPKHFDETVKILSENGYIQITQANWLKRKFQFFIQQKDVIFTSPDDRVRIELHWKLSGSYFSLSFELSELWNRLEKMNLGGIMVNKLCFEDLFIYLCLHGSRHEWKKLSWVCDVRELIRAYEKTGNKIDWKLIQKHAINHGCEKVVELGLFLINKVFGVKTDYPDYEKIINDTALLEIAGQVQKRIFSEKYVSSLKRDKYMYLLTLKERRIHRMNIYLAYFTFYMELMFTPSSLDKSIFHLPKLLYPLYFILRPVRLLFTYFNKTTLKKISLKKANKD